MSEFIGLLNFLGWETSETMQYGFRKSDGLIGKPMWFRNKVADALPHIQSVVESDLKCDVWFGINPVSPDGEGRAKSSEVTRVLSAYLDLDFKPDGLRSEKNALELVSTIQDALETDFLAMVHTGGGIQVYLPLAPDRTTDIYGASLTIKRIQLLAQSIAHGEQLGKIDNVSDLTRVFRVPGSRNYKYESAPEVFRVYYVVASSQEDSVKWLSKSDSDLLTLDPNSLET